MLGFLRLSFVAVIYLYIFSVKNSKLKFTETWSCCFQADGFWATIERNKSVSCLRCRISRWIQSQQLHGQKLTTNSKSMVSPLSLVTSIKRGVVQASSLFIRPKTVHYVSTVTPTPAQVKLFFLLARSVYDKFLQHWMQNAYWAALAAPNLGLL